MKICYYDYRKSSKSGRPDEDSRELYDAHQMLWSKRLPSKEKFELEVIKDSQLLLKIITDQRMRNLPSDKNNLSSDRMCPDYDDTYGIEPVKSGWVSAEGLRLFSHMVRTIGGYIVFPAHQVDGEPTINQARGNPKGRIRDRFDLTLECIRRFYDEEEREKNKEEREKNPLEDTLIGYRDYFKLFVNFKGYIDFFLLQDFVDEKYQVRFALPFDDFKGSPLPKDKNEYRLYMFETMELINKRNIRISE